MAHDRIINQHQPGLALYPRNLSYDLLPLIGPSGWSLLRALHDHADEQALTYRGTRPIAPTGEEMQALAGVGEASLLVIKELLHICGCLSWEDIRGKQEPRPGRHLKQQPTRAVVYYLHPLTGLAVTLPLVERVISYAQRSERAVAYLKANGLFRAQPAFLPTSVWPPLLLALLERPDWQTIFDHIHGTAKHQQYRAAATRWINSAAQIVATLELEQQASPTPVPDAVFDRAALVMARWQQINTQASPGGHALFIESQRDSAPSPHTPVNELTNQPTNKRTPEGEGSNRRGKGRRGARNEQGASGAQSGPALGATEITHCADAGGHTKQPADAVATVSSDRRMRRQVPFAAMDEQRRARPVQADATPETGALADAALWDVLPTILCPAGGGRPTRGTASLPYQPTVSEQRQARRLLRRYRVPALVHALCEAVGRYEPGPGQPLSVVRFGFAVGLPAFRDALANFDRADAAAPLATDGRSNNAPAPPDATVAREADVIADFWAEYERLTTRRPSRAERRHIELIARNVEYHHLLVWLDRWERAHAGTACPLTPAYFEACIAGGGHDHAMARPVLAPAGVMSRPHASAAVSSAAPVPPVLGPAQRPAYNRLVELGIKKALPLATLPGTTLELVEAWAVAGGDGMVKDRSAYIAAGVTTGRLPDVRAAAAPATAPVWLKVDIMKNGDESLSPGGSDLWQACLRQIESVITESEYETWLAPCFIARLETNVVVIAAPNTFVRQELDQRYRAVISSAFESIVGHAVDVHFVIDAGRTRFAVR